MWEVNDEQYKILVRETAWCGLRISQDTVYFLDGAGGVREGTIDTEKLEREMTYYKSIYAQSIPVLTVSGKSIDIKWMMIIASDTRSCRSFAFAEFKRVCQKYNISDFEFKSIAWNKTMAQLKDGLPLREIINGVNCQISKLEIKEKDIPTIKSSINMIECVRMFDKTGQPKSIKLTVKLNRNYSREELRPYIRKVNTDMMHKLMRHWKFKGYENTINQYRLARVYLNREYELEYDVELKEEFIITHKEDN